MDVVLGPVLFVLDVAPANRLASLCLSSVLVPCMLVGIVRPRPWLIALSVVAALVWLCLGVVGKNKCLMMGSMVYE